MKVVFHGTLSETTPEVHYIEGFRYPTLGGFVDGCDLQLGRQLVSGLAFRMHR